MLPGNLERKIAFLERHPTAAMVHSGFRFLDAAGDPTGPIMNWARLGEDTLEPGPSFVRRSIALGGLVCVSSVMLRSEHIAEERFDADDGPYADMALWLRVAGRGDVGFLPEPLSGLRVHQASASSAFQTVRVRRGRSHLTPAHADALRQAHGRYVARADLDPSTRDALAESLARADRRLRLSILASSRVPAPALRAAKRAVGWRPGARLHRLVALDQPLPAGSPATTDPSPEGAR
jgi:hypothetical protein